MRHQFTNDYSEIAHSEIAGAVVAALSEQNRGYGLDAHSERAAKLIKKRFGAPRGEVFFLSGGTQANMVVISYILRPYEAALAVDSGHINVHETGAVEGSAHKIYTVPGFDGKMRPSDIDEAMKAHPDEHKVKISLVYISDATETGTIYSRDELYALRKACDKYGLFLFIDGARIGTALVSSKNDVKPEDFGKVADAFYVGGTKNGLMSGEAVVFTNAKIAADFRYQIKNRGAMLAKGFVLGAQFERAFQDDLYFEMARNSDEMAEYIKAELKDAVCFANDSPTNQQFIKLARKDAERVMAEFGCELWDDLGDELVIRIVTSFATTKADADDLIGFIKSL